MLNILQDDDLIDEMEEFLYMFPDQGGSASAGAEGKGTDPKGKGPDANWKGTDAEGRGTDVKGTSAKGSSATGTGAKGKGVEDVMEELLKVSTA